MATTHYARVGEEGVTITAVLSADVTDATVSWIAANDTDSITKTAVPGADGAVTVTLTADDLVDANVGQYLETWRVTDGSDGEGPLDYPSAPRLRDRFVLLAALPS